MPNIRQTYEAALGRHNVGGTVWPESVPALSPVEATRAARRLYRWACGRPWIGPVIVTRGNRYSYIRYSTMYVNPEKGWRQLVHTLAHSFWRRENPGERPHSKGEARLEIRMAKQVIRRGWLDGRLRGQPKPQPAAPDRTAIKRATMDALRARIARWETKAKRADTALRKLKRRLAAHERHQ